MVLKEPFGQRGIFDLEELLVKAMRWECLFLGLAVLLACPGSAATWTEVGSAGSLPGTAQIAGGIGSLDAIFGNLSELTEVDMYQIRINDPLNFSAETVDDLFNVNDPKLFLFNGLGLGVFANDDGDGIGPQSRLPAGHLFGPIAIGFYYLAIGWFDNAPLNANGGLIFPSSIGTTGPDPIEGLLPVTAWNGDVLGRPDLPTQYQINLTGAQAIPEPGSEILLGAGLVLLLSLARRGRRNI